MSTLQRYRKKPDTAVTAVCVDLDTDGFTYKKWGGVQTCKPGDWLVDNDGDVYTIDAKTFESTYREVEPGRYVKSAPVWAEVADSDGVIKTKEGSTEYRSGDYLVYNGPNRTDGYAMGPKKFEEMYEPD